MKLEEFNNNESINQKDIKLLEQDIVRINENLDNIYLDNLKKVIEDEQFNRIKFRLENELKAKQDKLLMLVDNNQNRCNKDEENEGIEKYINEFLAMENPSRELIVGLIERIDIYEDKRIDIKFTFNIDSQTYV